MNESDLGSFILFTWICEVWEYHLIMTFLPL